MLSLQAHTAITLFNLKKPRGLGQDTEGWQTDRYGDPIALGPGQGTAMPPIVFKLEYLTASIATYLQHAQAHRGLQAIPVGIDSDIRHGFLPVGFGSGPETRKSASCRVPIAHSP